MNRLVGAAALVLAEAILGAAEQPRCTDQLRGRFRPEEASHDAAARLQARTLRDVAHLHPRILVPPLGVPERAVLAPGEDAAAE
jgi:hypothetical protein